MTFHRFISNRFQFVYCDDSFIEYFSTNAPLFTDQTSVYKRATSNRNCTGFIHCQISTSVSNVKSQSYNSSFSDNQYTLDLCSFTSSNELIHSYCRTVQQLNHGTRKLSNYIPLRCVQYLDCCQTIWPSDTVHEMFQRFKIDRG